MASAISSRNGGEFEVGSLSENYHHIPSLSLLGGRLFCLVSGVAADGAYATSGRNMLGGEGRGKQGNSGLKSCLGIP